MTAVAAAPPPELHAPDCDDRCSSWLGIGAPGCLPYPCRCNTYRASKPAWGRERCWWTKRGTDRVVSGCPCWGDDRTGKPAGCCAHHLASPRYAPPPAPRALDDPDVAPYVDWERPARVDVALLDWNGFDPEVEHSPYARRWKPEELTCPCPTPWDGAKGAKGWHCCGCHEHFASYSVGAVHRRRWTEPCRPPHTIIDVDTGAPLMYQDGKGVWGPLYPSAN